MSGGEEQHPSIPFQVRLARLDEREDIQRLISRSARELSSGDYTDAQIEGALRGAFGVDTQLILDGTYFVVEAQGTIVGCGGWSWRRTLFGGDSRSERDAGSLDPEIDAARIRAFFVDPHYVRRGIGRLLLQYCERAARARGFTRFALMGTLPGERLYAACGYIAQPRVRYLVADGVEIEFVPMMKDLSR